MILKRMKYGTLAQLAVGSRSVRLWSAIDQSETAILANIRYLHSEFMNMTTSILESPAAQSSTILVDEQETWWERWGLMAAAVATWCFLLAAAAIDHLTSLPHVIVSLLYLSAYLSGGTLAAWTALNDLRRGQVNVDLLMVTAAIGAATVNAWGEGAVLLALFSTSNALEHAALERTRRAVRSLMDLSPETATLQHDGREETVHVSALKLGDRVLVRPGDRIPVDGTVVDGRSEVDQAAITGESLPVRKEIGDPVFAATINQQGAMTVEVTKLAHESILAKIIAFVEEARDQKSDTERFADAFEGKYTIGVIVGAALVFLVPWFVLDRDAGDSFYRAMTLLVVASPCALVISTPASTLSALANAARNGVLFKGGNYLEMAGSIDTFTFDKTGTLTTGHQVVTDIRPVGDRVSEDELLTIAAAAERLSEHHVAVAITKAARARALELPEVTDFQAIAGKGIEATVAGRRIWIGNAAMAATKGVEMAEAMHVIHELRNEGKSAVMVADDEGPLGVLAVADSIRPEARQAVTDLRAAGVKRIIMLTGDNQVVAESIAAEVGIDDVRADLLPEEKLTSIRSLMEDGHGARVAMIGDGVNDAPALATATIGIAMGGSGTDVALETADVVLMGDDLRKLPFALNLSRRTRRTIVQNLAFSLTVIVVLISLTLTVGIPLPVGVVGHEGSTIIVVLNGLRLLRSRE
jgi:Cd2+/Zn2+-exporting ATPase